MAKKKWVIDESIPRTPEERKWVESELNKERTPEELKKAILGLEQGSGANWMMWFNKNISARLATCVMDPEIFEKEVDEEYEYIKSHFSEIKRGIIDIIKQNPQEWEIKEKEVPYVELKGLPKNEWKTKDMVVGEKRWGKEHFKNGFTKEEWAEIENVLNSQKSNSFDKNSIIKKVEELCAKLVQNYENWDKEGKKWKSKVEKEGGFTPEKKSKHKLESKKMEEKFLGMRSEIYGEIKDQILKDLTLWELDVEGNIQPIPGVSVNTRGAHGGYILFGYQPSQSYIHFFFEEPNKDYKKEITQAFVEEIKQNPQEWEIILEDKRDKPFVPEPMVANSEDWQVVKHKSGRRHNRGYQWYKNKPGFSDKEWAEIENALNSKKDKQIQPPKEKIKQIDLAEQIIQLEKEINQLKAKIQELKKKWNNSSEYQADFNHKEKKLQEKELKLNQLKDIVKVDDKKTKPKSNNFPTGLIIGGGILIVVSVMAVGMSLSLKRKKK